MIVFGSGSSFQRNPDVPVLTEKMLLSELSLFPGTINEYMEELQKTVHYIEVQVWLEKESF